MHVLGSTEVLHKALKRRALHAGHAVGARLLFVCQQADAGLVRVLNIKQSSQRRICVDSVVVPIAADHGTVDTDFADIESGNCRQFGRDEVLLHDTVSIVQEAQNGQLYSVFSIVSIRGAADQDIQAFSRDPFGQCFLHLVFCQMRQQISDHETGIARFAADDNVNGLSAFQCYNTVQFQRDGNPLVFFDAAVIMRLKIAHLILFIQRNLFEIQAG